jgi:hypothetical protein
VICDYCHSLPPPPYSITFPPQTYPKNTCKHQSARRFRAAEILVICDAVAVD